MEVYVSHEVNWHTLEELVLDNIVEVLANVENELEGKKKLKELVRDDEL